MSILFATILQSHSVKANLSSWANIQLAPGITISAPSNLALSHETPQDPRVLHIDDWGGKVGNRTFIASVTTTKKVSVGDSNAILSATVIQSVSRPNSRLEKMRDVQMSGWSGVLLSVKESDGSRTISKSFRIGERLVTLAVIAPASDSGSSDINRFLDSLKVKERGPSSDLGPELMRFPLGRSGLSASFPHAPAERDSKNADGSTLHSYVSEFVTRSFMVTYQDIPKGKPGPNLKTVGSYVLSGFHATGIRTSSFIAGNSSGERSDFTIGTQAEGSLLVYRLKNRILTLLTLAPREVEDSGTVKRFFRSVK